MSLGNRRFMGAVPLATLLAIFPATWLAATASAEERKLAVLLAYPIKQRPEINNQLPNADDIRDMYFDKTKNGQVDVDNPDGERVDSHAEWWEEISYGEVTVSGAVYGWVNLPWRTLPTGIELGGGVVQTGRAPHIDLDGAGAGYSPGQGEFFDSNLAKYRFDFDGAGGIGRDSNFDAETGPNADIRHGSPRIQPFGAGAIDPFGLPVYTPGERFLDLNNNRIYDAGVFEWGIDKNGNGYIDRDLQASSWFELLGCCIQLPRDEQGMPGDPDYVAPLQLGFRGWFAEAEWYDSNGDGHWNKDLAWQKVDNMGNPLPDFDDTGAPLANQRVWFPPGDSNWPNSGIDNTTQDFSELWPAFVAQPNTPDSPGAPTAPLIDLATCGMGATGNPTPFFVRVIRGDWGGTEPWFDVDGDFAAGQRAVQDEDYRGVVFGVEPNDERPAFLFEFLKLALFDPDSEAEYFDEQWNSSYDFPEPFEDRLRYWSSGAHQFVPVPNDYIVHNYPGDAASLGRLIGANLNDGNPVNDVVGRIGNHRYDAPDSWSNNGRINSTNKLQQVDAEPADAQERTERNRRTFLTTPPPEYYNDHPIVLPNGQTVQVGWSLTEFWQTWFGTSPPPWPEGGIESIVPYLRRFNPADPVIPLSGDTDPRRYEFIATHGGPFGYSPLLRGTRSEGGRYRETHGTVLPNFGDARDGSWDGPAEYRDLPSSIYHAGGDGQLGEVTSPGGDDFFGQDLGGHNPGGSSSTGDTIIPAAGPLAFNVHGDNGWDAGNVLNVELLTWRRDGTSRADSILALPGVPPQVHYARDINLDGMLDLGETLGLADEFGVPFRTPLHSYGLSPFSGRPANGNPQNEYPHNRTRAMEDVVAALDNIVDWDEFRGGGAFGNDILGLLLLPEGTGPNGMFTLPASGRYLIRTRDQTNPNAVGLERYVPLSFFDGMGIEIGGEGEGGGLDASTFQIAFAGHEYGHIWEGWPDLYDYDVRALPPLNIVNNPIGRWCVMAGGGLVHPVPILKADSGWVQPVDLTRVLDPGIAQQVVIQPWEFDKDRTVLTYTNPLFPGEQYWFWATSDFKPSPTAINFDSIGPSVETPQHGLPGMGLLVMRTDRGSNTEALPPQQRIAAGRFTYQVIQADGLQELENGQDTGDPGDPFPGTSDRRSFTNGTDPASKWGNGAWTGLDIRNIQRNGHTGVVTITFNWSPRELPTLTWVRPSPFGQAGEVGVSTNGMYQLRTRAFDQFGGTDIKFVAVPYTPPGRPNNYVGLELGVVGKGPGDEQVTFNLDVQRLGDGIYTFFTQLMPGVGADGRTEAEFSPPRASIDNVGDGNLSVLDVNTNNSFFERWNVRCVNAQPPGGETWDVVGSISQAQGTAVTGQNYTSPNGAVSFRINLGVRPFRVNDEFVFVTTGRTEHSAAVLVADGEIVQPLPPVAAGRIISGTDTGLAPFTVSFKHDESTDPRNVPLTYEWTFGDGSDPVQSTDPNEVISHTFEAPRTQPYNVTLTAINIFGLSSTISIPVHVNAAARPAVQVSANPRSGDAPLTVNFSSAGTSDPNPGTQALDYVWDFGDGSLPSFEANPAHVYSRSGIFVARLTVTNRPYGVSASNQLEIRVGGAIDNNLPPVAEIDVERTSGSAPLNLRFNGDRSVDPENGVLEYMWNFGDGSAPISGSSAVEHTFSRAGDFRVTLTVTDNTQQTDSSTITITVFGDPLSANQAPLARITTSSRQGAAPLTVRFDAAASADPEGTPLTYSWDFGDGSPQVQSVTAEHTYRDPQAYTVILRVRDAQGAEGAASVQVMVNPASGNQSGQDNPGGGGGNGGGTDVPACAAGCGPVGMLPMVWMLIGIGAMRGLTRPRCR